MLIYVGGIIVGEVVILLGFFVGLCGNFVGFFVVGVFVFCFLVVDWDVEFGYFEVVLWIDKEGMIDDGVVVFMREGVRCEVVVFVFCGVFVVV